MPTAAEKEKEDFEQRRKKAVQAASLASAIAQAKKDEDAQAKKDKSTTLETSPLRPKGFTAGWGFAQICSIILMFLVCCYGGLLVFLYTVPMYIHSCELYVPHKIQAMDHAFKSLHEYSERETFSSLWAEISAGIWAEGLNWEAPIPSFAGRTAGKHLLMVGGSRTPVALARAQQLQVKITIIDDVSVYPYIASKLGDQLSFIAVKGFGKISIESPQTIMKGIEAYLENGGEIPVEDQPSEKKEKKAPIKFDGVFTLVEDHGPLTSFIGEVLKLPVSPYKAAKTARSKLAVREAMKAAGLMTPRFAAINSEDDAEAAAKHVGFPAFLKPVFGVQATFSTKVNDHDELIDTLRDFQARIDADHHPIYHYGRQMILESLMKGSELQLELVLMNGEFIAYSWSSEYTEKRDMLLFPPIISNERKKRLLDLAMATVKAIGLTQGIVHVELFDHEEEGPHVVEINNRLTRGFLGLNFLHQLVFGQIVIDYYGSQFLIALGNAPLMRTRNETMLKIAVSLDDPSTEWWHVDPKDAPNRGWEREGRCGVFVGTSSEHAVKQAKAAKHAMRSEGQVYLDRKKGEDWNLLVWQILFFTGSITSCIHMFIAGDW